MIRLVVVDDQALVRVGLRKILDGEADMAVVGEAENGSQAVTAAAALRPDVVLMDIRMPELDGHRGDPADHARRRHQPGRDPDHIRT